MKPLFQSTQPAVQPVQGVSPSYGVSLVSTQLPATVAPVISDADIEQLGEQNASRHSQITQKILANVKASDTEGFGAQLNSLIATSKQLDPSKMGKPGMIGKLLGLGGNVKERLLSQYATVESRMNTIVADLDKMATLMKTRVDDLDVMFEENFQTHELLRSDVERGNQMVIAIDAQIQSLGTPTDAFGAQQIADLQSRADRLRKRIDDLERGMQLAKLAAPEIRMQQAHNRSLANSVRDIKVTTIPAWQGVFTRYIIGLEAKKGAELVNSVYDATNAAFRAQADQLRENSQHIAKAQQRSVVDIDTLVHMQDQLIASVDDALRIANEGRQAREAAKPKLQQLETTLIQRFTPQLTHS